MSPLASQLAGSLTAVHLEQAASVLGAVGTSWEGAAISFVPITIVLGFVFFVYRGQFKSAATVTKLQEENIARHTQHMERMEELLQRIAVAMEQQNKR